MKKKTKSKKEKERSRTNSPESSPKNDNKNQKKSKIPKINQNKKPTENNNNKNRNQSELNSTNKNSSENKININHHWKKYYDEHYKQIFYHNPFTNESVWELPKDAIVEDSPPLTIPSTQSNSEQKNIEDNTNENVQSYKEVEAIESEELKQKLQWRKAKLNQLKEWLLRPARQQVTESKKECAYTEGHYDYNIWYDKYLTDRKEDKNKTAAETKCNPTTDTGYTRADKQLNKHTSYFCLYFARGCCSEGVNCKYYHHVPTFEEAKSIENSKDIFGRSRFSSALKDNGGVGIFTKNCKTLYITDLKKVERRDANKEMVKILYENFSPWGEIEDIQYIPYKSICYVKYAHRCFAEFAKEAMMKQSLIGEEIISVTWAYNVEEIDPMEQKILEKEEENMFINAVMKNKDDNDDGENIENNVAIRNCLQLQNIFNYIQKKEGSEKEEE